MKILVIDDEPAVRYAVTRILEGSGYEVTTAADGMRGMSQFRLWQPDLVITDLIMPEQEGMQTIKQIREADPAVKILAISGGGRLVNVDFLQVARRLGADEVLAKPFDSRDLLTTVRRLLPSPGQGTNAPRYTAPDGRSGNA
jgi:DNA-binding response OmpR family regulator